MTTWERLLQFSMTGPFVATWLILAVAAGAFITVALARRMFPREERHRGTTTATLLLIGLLLGLPRLGLVAAGAGTSAAGRAIGAAMTFFVAMGVVGTFFLLTFDMMSARAHVRVPSVLRDLLQLTAGGVIVFGLLSQSGLDVTSLITTSAVLTAIVGLALQNTIANLIAGLALHINRDLGVDDWVQVGTHTGRINQIRWRSTTLRTTDGDTVIVPNSQLLSQEVHNFSRPTPQHRTSVRVAFHYRHPPNEIRKILIEAVTSAPGVLEAPAATCFPMEFAENSLSYVLRFWIKDFARQTDIEGDVRGRIWYAARRAGLEIPFPMRTIVTGSEIAERLRAESALDLAERTGQLERLQLFSPLGPVERETLARAMRRVDFATGEVIIRQDDPGDSLFLIARGDVRVSLMQGEIDQDVAQLGPGKFFGEMSLMTGEPRAATCTAMTDVSCHVIDRVAFQQIMTLRPHIADEMSLLLTTRQQALEKSGDELSARAAQAAEDRSRLLARIRSFFDLD